jgi:hypothetical protein
MLRRFSLALVSMLAILLANLLAFAETSAGSVEKFRGSIAAERNGKTT